MNKTGQPVRIGLCIVGMIGVFAYVMLTVTLAGQFCPTTTFAHGPMKSSFFASLGAALVIVCSVYLTVGFWPMAEGKLRFKQQFVNRIFENHWIMFLTITVGGLALGGVVLLNYFDSYYCLLPKNVYVHPSAFSGARSQSWNDVTTVQAGCGHSKSGSFGQLVISFQDGQTILAALGSQEYNTVRKALAGHSYTYITDLTMLQHDCPPVLYQMLTSPATPRQ